MFSTSQQVAAQVLRIAEMNTQQIWTLNLQKTVVLIPGGILEGHGPYLPSYADGYADDAYTQDLAKAIVARPRLDGSPIPANSAGQRPRQHHWRQAGISRKLSRSYGDAAAIYMDLANELGEQGFRWIFLVHNHGAPNHHKALSTRPRIIFTMSTAAPWCICSA